MKSVYSAVRTGPLNEAVCATFFKVKMDVKNVGSDEMAWREFVWLTIGAVGELL
jgi:hypothetical protein